MKETNTEKITINANIVDLGYIDLLISEGHYSSRTEFIKTAIKSQLANHSYETHSIITKRQIDIGIITIDKEIISNNINLNYMVLGKLIIPPNIAINDLKNSFSKIKVFGVVKCSDEIRQYYNL